MILEEIQIKKGNKEMIFSDFITEQKNTHMTHIEDKVLYGGVDGTRQAILALRSLRDALAGEHEGTVSVKWDGAPAIFAGIDPNERCISGMVEFVNRGIRTSVALSREESERQAAAA